MSFDSRTKNLFALGCLIATTWTILATSTGTLGLLDGTLIIKSDCAGATRESQVHALLGQIDSPAGVTFMDFGFPTTTVTDDKTVSGLYNGVPRTCLRTIGDKVSSTGQSIYSCYDNSEFVCNIFVHR